MPGLRADHVQHLSNLNVYFSAGSKSLENLRDIVLSIFHNRLLPVSRPRLVEVGRQSRHDMQDVQPQTAGVRHPKCPLEHLEGLGTEI
jgi:hypothetical protein